MRRQPNTRKAPRKTNSLKIFFLLVLVVILTLLGVYLAFTTMDEPPAFFARSINDASYDCEEKILDQFDTRLVSKHYDQYSSRYDADDHQYIIFYRVNARHEMETGAPVIREHLVKCVVWERLGFVSHFHVFDSF